MDNQSVVARIARINSAMGFIQIHRSSFFRVHIIFSIVLSYSSFVSCLKFNYTVGSLSLGNETRFLFNGSATTAQSILKITADSQKEDQMKNTAGRVLFREPLNLRSKDSSNLASFNTSFVMSIMQAGNSSLGEGMAFIITSSPNIPLNFSGKWPGMGLDRQDEFVALVFNTNWRDGKGNIGGIAHGGMDRFVSQANLTEYCMNISDGSNYSVSIWYDGVNKNLTVDVHNINGSRCGSSDPIIPALDLDLTKRFNSEKVFVGFSGSTSQFYELNYVYSWSFVDDHSLQPLGNNRSNKTLWISLITTVALVLLLVLVIALIIFFKKRSRVRSGRSGGNFNVDSALMVNSTRGPVKFRLRQLKFATNNFDPRLKLGEGGFGAVYKGFLKESQEHVAVKRVSRDSRQGVQEFVSEITTIGKLSHKNLARLIGWCCDKNELLLVYEFLSNGSLDKHLYFDEDKTSLAPLNWKTRLKIIYGIASALFYLHDGCPKRIIHRDVKPSNVMLDKDNNARLGDFGLARTVKQDGHTHHTTLMVAGTPGYIAPEYRFSGKASVESDVYAFGAVALEVASGRKPAVGRTNLHDNRVIDWVWELYDLQRLVEAADPILDGKFNLSQMEMVLRLGMACCHPNSGERPSMRVALQVLSGEVSPPEPPRKRPSFRWSASDVIAGFEEGELSTNGGRLTQSIDISGR